jgi:glycosyltransferase involved in cell wall biosynthesis
VSGPRGVVYLNPTGEIGGAERSLLDLAAGLDRQRWAPRIVCLGQGPLLAEGAGLGLPTESVSVPDAFQRMSLRGTRTSVLGLAAGVVRAAPALLAIRRAAAGTMAGAAPAIVHSNGNKTHLLAMALRRRRTRVVWHVRDFLPDRAPERWLLRLARLSTDAVIANSSAVAAHLRRLGASPRLVHPIANGIDLVRFAPEGPQAELRAEAGWPKHARLVGMVGMLARWKGQEVFLQAAAALAKRHPDVRFVVVGSEIYRTAGHGGFASALERQAGELGLGEVLAFTGHRRDIPEVLRALDVVVHASIEPEPFGRVIAEAMACARPVVWARGGGADEVVGDTALAALGVPGGNPVALAAAIERVLSDPEGARAWAAEGRTRVATHFDLGTHVGRVQDLYEMLARAR